MSPYMNRENTSVMACVLDTETTFINDKPRLVYHWGTTIGDITQEHSFNWVKQDYYVLEVIENIDNFLHKKKSQFDTNEGYSYNKAMARAWKDATRNPTKVKSWKYIIEEWQDFMHSMNVQFLTSYNFNFDIGLGDKVGAIRKTHSQTSDKTFYLPRNTDFFCLMNIAGRLFMDRKYLKFVNSLPEDMIGQMRSDKGNPKYSAEACIRYLNQDVWFQEQHTAQRDSLLEMRLLQHFWRNWKGTIKSHFVNNIKGVSTSDIKNNVPKYVRLAKQIGDMETVRKWKAKQKKPNPRARRTEVIETAKQMEMPL